jgi:hypothetical protein
MEGERVIECARHSWRMVMGHIAAKDRTPPMVMGGQLTPDVVGTQAGYEPRGAQRTCARHLRIPFSAATMLVKGGGDQGILRQSTVHSTMQSIRDTAFVGGRIRKYKQRAWSQ